MKRTLEQMRAMSIWELAEIVNNPEESGVERAKVASNLHARIDEVCGGGWLSHNHEDRQAVRQALKFDTSQFMFA